MRSGRTAVVLGVVAMVGTGTAGTSGVGAAEPNLPGYGQGTYTMTLSPTCPGKNNTRYNESGSYTDMAEHTWGYEFSVCVPSPSALKGNRGTFTVTRNGSSFSGKAKPGKYCSRSFCYPKMLLKVTGSSGAYAGASGRVSFTGTLDNGTHLFSV